MKLLNIKSTSALFLFVTFWLSLLPLSAYALNDIVKLDRIVTIVDKNAITEQELEAKVRTVSDQLTKQGKQLPQERILRKQILERLIVDSIQLQLAAERGIKVNEIQLEKTIERIAEQNQMSVETFKTALANDGVSYNAFREDMRNEITIARLKESEINNRINISEGEVDNYLTTQENSKDGKQEEFELSQILIRTPEESSPQDIEAAQIKVEEVLAELNKGESFEKVSASFSDAPNALEGGNMGWRSSSQIPPAFLALLKEMSVGQASKPIRSPNGFHIIN